MRILFPETLARVVPGGIPLKSLWAPNAVDVFVTDASRLVGKTADEIADLLTILKSSTGFNIIEMPSKTVNGIASPVGRTNPGFVGGGQTAGGLPEFVIPNGPIPADAIIRFVP